MVVELLSRVHLFSILFSSSIPDRLACVKVSVTPMIVMTYTRDLLYMGSIF